MTRYAIPKREPLWVELEAFRDAVLGKQGRIVTIHDGAETVAARRSHDGVSRLRSHRRA